MDHENQEKNTKILDNTTWYEAPGSQEKNEQMTTHGACLLLCRKTAAHRYFQCYFVLAFSTMLYDDGHSLFS